jgi:hypothetical protein
VFSSNFPVLIKGVYRGVVYKGLGEQELPYAVRAEELATHSGI